MSTTPLDTVHLERAAEALLVKRVKMMGGQCLKLAPTEAGIPDRMVLLPGGVLELVEVKSETGRLSNIQHVWHQRAAALGIHVVVLRGRAEVLKYIARHTEARWRFEMGKPPARGEHTPRVRIRGECYLCGRHGERQMEMDAQGRIRCGIEDACKKRQDAAARAAQKEEA